MTAEEPGSTEKHPRVFLSHSKLDNERFVKLFAASLRERGVDAWYDEWELQPGDSLVDKIFEEGLKDAEAFVVVVSNNSVNSRWVKEEINAAVVKRIEHYCKLIPVVLDGVELPQALKSTKYQPIADTNAYPDEFDTIVRAIYGITEKPPLGDPPGYASVLPIPGLQAIDTQILQIALQQVIDQDNEIVSSKNLLEALAEEDVSERALLDTLEVLDSKGYIKIIRTMAPGIDGMSASVMTTLGIYESAKHMISDYSETTNNVAAYIANNNGGSDTEIASSLDQPRVLIENVIDLLVAQGLVRVIKMSGPTTSVQWVNPSLRRWVQEH